MIALKIVSALLCFIALCSLVGAWLFSVLNCPPEPEDPNEDRPEEP